MPEGKVRKFLEMSIITTYIKNFNILQQPIGKVRGFVIMCGKVFEGKGCKV